MSCAFCIKRLVARSVKDQKFIASKPCGGEITGHTISEGEYVRWNGHILRCSLKKWKRMSYRPALECCKCASTFWPSSLSPRSVCSLIPVPLYFSHFDITHMLYTHPCISPRQKRSFLPCFCFAASCTLTRPEYLAAAAWSEKTGLWDITCCGVGSGFQNRRFLQLCHSGQGP